MLNVTALSVIMTKEVQVHIACRYLGFDIQKDEYACMSIFTNKDKGGGIAPLAPPKYATDKDKC